jgi:hypothetical protein
MRHIMLAAEAAVADMLVSFSLKQGLPEVGLGPPPQPLVPAARRVPVRTRGGVTLPMRRPPLLSQSPPAACSPLPPTTPPLWRILPAGHKRSISGLV